MGCLDVETCIFGSLNMKCLDIWVVICILSVWATAGCQNSFITPRFQFHTIPLACQVVLENANMSVQNKQTEIQLQIGVFVLHPDRIRAAFLRYGPEQCGYLALVEVFARQHSKLMQTLSVVYSCSWETLFWNNSP